MNVIPSRALQVAQLDLHLFAQLEIERSQRLVEQQHLRLIDECPRKRDALLLPTGELRRPPIFEPAQLHQIQHFPRMRGALAQIHPAHARPIRNVLQHGHVREQRIVLEHCVDVALVRRHGRHIAAVEQHLPFIRQIESRDESRAGRSCPSPMARASRRTRRIRRSAIPGRPRAPYRRCARPPELDRRRRWRSQAPSATAHDGDVVRRPSAIRTQAPDSRRCSRACARNGSSGSCRCRWSCSLRRRAARGSRRPQARLAPSRTTRRHHPALSA